jgi:phosphoribosylanthranilate isomerase
MKIKVCGMKDKQNIEALEKVSEVDYIGHIFAKQSPRFMDQNEGSSALSSIGVFVNSSREEIEKTTNKYDLSYVQLHGEEKPAFSKSINESIKPVIKAIAISEKDDFKKTDDYEGCCTYFLFDTKTKLRGGSGKKFDWNFINEYNGKTPFFLSGGIRLEDVDSIKNINHPLLFGVDINSGFEIEPGLKNIEEIKLFAKQLKA